MRPLQRNITGESAVHLIRLISNSSKKAAWLAHCLFLRCIIQLRRKDSGSAKEAVKQPM